jgi:gamma-glutamyltranspeptidase / glutathione hydrolase
MVLERPPVYVPHAAAATAHPLATQAALDLLRRGGSAADAAVGAGAVLTVVEPWASHIGGDGFGIVWDAAERRARAIQGSGEAPRGVRVEMLQAAGRIPLRGAMSITVPGMVGAWFHLLEARGRLPVHEVFAPAIALAADGFPVGGRWEKVFRRERELVGADALLTSCEATAGSFVRQPELAATLRRLADEGADAFYRGELGARIAEAVAERGGALALDDLRRHETEEVEPLAVDLEGLRLLEQPPPSQGAMVLAMMVALEEADVRGWRIEGTDARALAREIHLQVETYRRARAYRDHWLCDPRVASDSQLRRIDHWLSPEHAAGTCDRIDLYHRRDIVPSSPAEDVRDTTHLCVADGDGNAVSWIQSIFHPFGAGFVVPGTGIILNNRMNGFSLDPVSPNVVAPGKRPIHTLNAWMALRDGRPWLVGGTPGAERQIQTNVQILRARAARNLPLAEALRMPRWGIDEQERIALEGRIPREVRRRLERYGHTVVRVGPWEGSGFVQAIERLPDGGWAACTDPRGEGLAAGF